MAMKKIPSYFGLQFPEHFYRICVLGGGVGVSLRRREPSLPALTPHRARLQGGYLPSHPSSPFQNSSPKSPGGRLVLGEKESVWQRGKNQTNLSAAALPPAETWPVLLTVPSAMAAPTDCPTDGHSQMNPLLNWALLLPSEFS